MVKARGVAGLLPTLRRVATMSDKLLRGLEGSHDGLLGNARLDLGGCPSRRISKKQTTRTVVDKRSGERVPATEPMDREDA